MSSQVEIVNNALVEIGEATITSLTQNTKAARVANRVWDNVRREMLTRYRWNFAKGRASLAADSTAPEFGYARQFPVPDDFLALIGIYDSAEDLRNYTATTQAYNMEGRNILSDATVLYVTYIRDISDTGQFDPLFESALVYKLAMRLAPDLTGGSERLSQISQLFTDAIKAAKFSNAIQNAPEIIMATEWLDSRWSDGRGPYRAGPVA